MGREAEMSVESNPKYVWSPFQKQQRAVFEDDECKISEVKRMMVDFGADMVNPRSSAHVPTLDAWAVRVSVIRGTLGSE